MSVLDINNLTTSICPLLAAAVIGVIPFLSGIFGVSVLVINNLTTSICPLLAAAVIGVAPFLSGTFGASHNELKCEKM